VNFKKIKSYFSNKSKAFTLVELLVVLAIIGILASIIVVSLQTTRTKARDTRRKADMEAIRGALEVYRNTNGSYPNSLLCQFRLDVWCSSAYGINWIPGLAPDYISVVPVDPIPFGGNFSCLRPESEWENNYFYRAYNNNQDYKLVVSTMESAEGQKWAAEDGGAKSQYYELFSPGAQALWDW